MELLIVVAIIGLLASMILVGLSSFRSRGRDARRVADVKQVQNGLEIYYAKNNMYPSVTTGWVALEEEIRNSDIGITQIPYDPLYNKDNDAGPTYVYVPENGDNPQSYLISVTLEDANSQSLKNDLDGNMSLFNNTNCDDPVYCVQF